MKKLLVLFVALSVASVAFATDFSFSWDTDWGWASDFDKVYNSTASELELAVSADVDEYNAFAIELEPNSNGNVVYNYFKITTDLGAYLGLSGVGVSWVNGFTDPGDEEYADVTNVGLQNISKIGLKKDWVTDVNLDFGPVWASVAANWNLAGADTVNGGTPGQYTKELQLLAGSVDALPGLSVEVGFQMNDDWDSTASAQVTENIFQIDGAYLLPVDAAAITLAGSFVNYSEAGTQMFGAGLNVDYSVDDMTALNASVSFDGNDSDAFANLAGGVGATYGDFGADVDFQYAVVANSAYTDKNSVVADGDLLGVDVSGVLNVGAAAFRVGYAVTNFGWSNNSRADVPTEGGAYMKVTCDF